MIKDIVPIHVLVIEDNMGDYLLIKDYLEEQVETLSIKHVTKYVDAITVLTNTQNKFDVVLLDLTLPDNRGDNLIQDIVALCPESPVIVITGFGDVEFGIKSLSLKASDYLIKDDINSSSLYKSIKYNIERKKTNYLLEESEKKYSNLFQLSPQPMWLFDITDFNFFKVNKAAIEKYGYESEEFLNMSIFDISADVSTLEENKAAVLEISKNESAYKGRFKHKKKNKEIIDVDIYSNLITINEKKYESVIAIDITDKIRVEHTITKAIIKTQEDERFEIGSELHDNVCQILASSQLSLDMLTDQLPPTSIHWLNKSKQYISLALEEIRNISHRLAPSFFDYTTIEDTIKELLNDFNIDNKHDVSINVTHEITDYKLTNDIQLNLYRILQEQLRNISKYAQATKVIIDLSIQKNNLKMTIEDNGIGFDFGAIKKGIGLSNIKRRTELFSGTLEIVSSPGNGCTLHVSIPLSENNIFYFS